MIFNYNYSLNFNQFFFYNLFVNTFYFWLEETRDIKYI